jgi:hypothetical protein
MARERLLQQRLKVPEFAGHNGVFTADECDDVVRLKEWLSASHGDGEGEEKEEEETHEQSCSAGKPPGEGNLGRF